MSTKLCIICCQPIPLILISSLKSLPGSNGSKRLNDILIVYFITKKLLKLTDKKCLQFVETRRNSEVIRMCGSCEDIVNKAVDCHQKILRLEDKINDFGDDLRSIINKARGGRNNAFSLKSGDNNEAFKFKRDALKAEVGSPKSVELCDDSEDFADISPNPEIEDRNASIIETTFRKKTTGKEKLRTSKIRKRKNSSSGGDSDSDYDPGKESFKSRTRSITAKKVEGRNQASEGDYHDDESKPSSGTYACKTCNVVYKCSKAFGRHQEEHKASIRLNHKFDCDKCGFPASCEMKLRYHKRRFHQEIFKHSCSICGYESLRRTYLKRHMLKHSTNYSKPKKAEKKFKCVRKGQKIEKIYECNLCDAKYKSCNALEKHLQEHKKCEEAGSRFDCDICKFPCRDEAGLNLHKTKTHDAVGFVCQLCNRKFIAKNKLRAHLLVHKRYDQFKDSTGLYKCRVCPFSGSLQGFILHKNLKHKDLRLDDPDGKLASYLCNQCGLSFTTRLSLKNHVKNRHENKFKYNCEVCGKGFEVLAAFNDHMKTHEKNRSKEFVCNCCGAMYSHKRTLDDHMIRFHPDQIPKLSTGQGVRAEKPGHHKCKWCDEVFSFKYLLVNHLPIAHKDKYNFSCEICNKAYISASSLKLHKQINHSDGAQKYSCEFCGKAFVHKHYVICHYRSCAAKRLAGEGLNPTNSSELSMKSSKN